MTANDDACFLREATELARRGIGNVEPNPPVGAVLVKDGVVVGRGYHAAYGDAHAEVVAIRAAGANAYGATLYVTLEPCSTHGKTPPCVAAVIEAGIERVVVKCVDPNPRHRGAGVDMLRAAGIRVDSSPGDADEEGLLKRFRQHVDSTRPFVIAKWAETLDGRIATRIGESKWISSEASRRRVHDLRGHVDAIVVGRGTVERDDPLLTARPPGPRCARRVVFDRMLASPVTWRAVREGGPPITFVHGVRAPEQRRRDWAARGVDLIEVGDREPVDQVKSALALLRLRGVGRLLIEGGPTLLGSFHDARVIDQVVVFVAPKLFGGAGAPSPIGGRGVDTVEEGLRFEWVRWETLTDDAVFTGFVASDA